MGILAGLVFAIAVAVIVGNDNVTLPGIVNVSLMVALGFLLMYFRKQLKQN